MNIEAKTLVELKSKIRKKMKWPDRRTWSKEEKEEFSSKYLIEMDSSRNVFVAKNKE